MSLAFYTPNQLENRVALYIRFLETKIDKLQREVNDYSQKLNRKHKLKIMKKSINSCYYQTKNGSVASLEFQIDQDTE